MDYKGQIEALKNLEAIAYGHSINGEVLGMDCSEFEQIMVDTSESITELLVENQALRNAANGFKDRAEVAEAENAELRKNRPVYQYCILGTRELELCAEALEIASEMEDKLKAAEDRIHELAKCSPYWDALFDENEEQKITLDRLRELVEADREGRCVVLPTGGYTDKDGKNALKSAMNTCFYHNNPVTRYIADAVAEKLTREAAEPAKEGDQDE